MKFAIFKIGQEDFGIAIDKVVEILNTQKVYTLPELPDFLSGVITVRGEVVPLLDLRIRFGIAAAEAKELIIIVRYDVEKIGLLVDEIQEIISLNSNEIMTPPTLFKGLKKNYLSGIGKKDDRIFILLNIDYLLTSEEKIILKETEEMLEENAGTGTSPKR
jgi:purine-binding chemotaxis protein CheW